MVLSAMGQGSRGDFGVYIHYPWCRRRCDYCDFAIAVAPLGSIPHRAYLDAVLAELERRAPELAGRRLVSIYLGGGTPSLWPPALAGEAIAAVAARFDVAVADLAEVTLEANPIDCTAESLAGWRAAGVSRLSIGVQSVSAGELAVLGRDHRMGDGLAALERSRGAGFALSADVILGTPAASGGAGQAAHRALDSLRRIADLEPAHLSVYELTIEERAPLGAAIRRGDIEPLDGDRLAELYLAAAAELESRGYEHYEISSYARPGSRAVHNSLYWRGAEYLGLGASAASFRLDGGGAERWENVRSVGRYLAAADPIESRRRQDADAVARDRIWLGLRTSDGVARDLLEARPGLLGWLLEAGLAEVAGDAVRPTQKGFLFADRVADRVLS
jgi:oxygen-independent coproporphyrinogen III oxidase